MTTTRIAGLMAGKTVLVTGATGGIGKATALGLARMGAHVAITGRHRGRTEAAAREIRAVGGQVDLFVADLSSQSQLRGLAAEVLDRLPRIDVLVNNVGGFCHVTEDGYERTFALNHLAPFLLTNLLLDRMQHSTAARVVTVSSNAHAMGRIDFENLQGKGPTPSQGLQPVQARQRPLHLRAGQTAARDHRHRQCAAPRRRAHRLRGRGSCQRPAVPHSRGSTLHESPTQGAATSIHVASAPELRHVSGRYFANRTEKRSAERTYDQAVAAQLWRVSTKLVHLTDT